MRNINFNPPLKSYIKHDLIKPSATSHGLEFLMKLILCILILIISLLITFFLLLVETSVLEILNIEFDYFKELKPFDYCFVFFLILILHFKKLKFIWIN